MRWTIRGVPETSADSVRQLAADFEVTLGDALTICIEAGLPQARRRLAATRRPSEFRMSGALADLERLLAEFTERSQSSSGSTPSRP